MTQRELSRILISILGVELYQHLKQHTTFSVVLNCAAKKCFTEKIDTEDANALRDYIKRWDAGETLDG